MSRYFDHKTRFNLFRLDRFKKRARFNPNRENVGGGGDPFPAPGHYIDLSFNGNTPLYVFGVDSAIAANFNYIKRTGAATTFDSIIKSDQTFYSDSFHVIGGDVLTGGAIGAWAGFGDPTILGTGFADLEYALRADKSGANINWEVWESGVKVYSGTTTIFQEKATYWIALDGAGNYEVFVNGDSIYVGTYSFSDEQLSVKYLGRDLGSPLVDHLYLRSIDTPNKLLTVCGDSNTFSQIIEGVNGSSWVARCIASGNHEYFQVNLARSGDTAAMLIADQMPQFPDFYKPGYATKLLYVEIGLNDVRFGVPSATTISEIDTIVAQGQSDGYFVIVATIKPDFGNVWADRIVINDDTIANTRGADLVIDYTITDLETNPLLFDSIDKIHLNKLGAEYQGDIVALAVQGL